jgi:cytochrome c5
MRKVGLLILAVLIAASVAMAQTTPDVLGAHNGYGRGCVMCHAPHGGAAGNGVATTDTNNGTVAQWGQDLSPLYGKTIGFSGDGSSTKYPVTLPSGITSANSHDGSSVVLFCLSCHDGATAKVGMMANSTVEVLPIVGKHAPTLFGTTVGNTATYYANEHPVGPSANVGCTTNGTDPYGWDCNGGGGTLQPIQMNGTASSAFLTNNPSSFWNKETFTACGAAPLPACPTGDTWGYTASGNPLTKFGTTTVNGVTCTTCHDQHSMSVWTVGTTNYTTMFFVKGQYTPSAGGNAVAQFCRNCHGGESNEMHGLMNTPTT